MRHGSATRRRNTQAPRTGAVRRRKRTYGHDADHAVRALSWEAGAPGASRVVACLLLVAMISLLAWFFVDLRFYIYAAEVRGVSLATVEDVYSSSGIDTMSIFYVHPARAAERILRGIPALVQTNVQCRWPNQVSIQVREREVQFVWDTAGGRFLLATDGRVVRVEDGHTEGLVLIRDLDRKPLRVGDDVDRSVVSAAAQLRTLLPQVRAFDYSRERGLSFVEEHGWRVYVGDDQDLDLKVATLRSVLQHLASRGTSATSIDVRFRGSASYE